MLVVEVDDTFDIRLPLDDFALGAPEWGIRLHMRFLEVLIDGGLLRGQLRLRFLVLCY